MPEKGSGAAGGRVVAAQPTSSAAAEKIARMPILVSHYAPAFGAMERFFWICLAGAAGVGTRYLVGLWAGERLGTAFPYATLIVNVAGCFLIALVMQTALNVATFSPTLRLALTTGFLGGLTTYSSFAYETTKLVQDGARGAALANVAITTVACFVAVALGLFLANTMTKA